MECQSSAQALRKAREGQGLSQRRLALRAGTSQDAISRIERGAEEPTVERLSQLMLAMGLRVGLTIEPLPSSVPVDKLSAAKRQSHAERLREAASWNRTAARIAAAAEKARRGGEPPVDEEWDEHG